jgi:RimJ/RimL family protein N-acetyltransferase
MSQVVNVIVGLSTAFLGYLIGRVWQSLVARQRYRRARRFWRPVIGDDFQIVISRFEPEGFREPTGVVGGGDAIASRILADLFDRIGLDRPETLYVDEPRLDRRKNLILLGGPDSNRVTAEAMRRVSAGLHVVDPGPGAPMEVHDTLEGESGDVAGPRAFVADPADPEMTDYGVVTRVRNPFNPRRALVVISGAYGYGTWAGALVTQTPEFLRLCAEIDGRADGMTSFLRASCARRRRASAGPARIVPRGPRERACSRSTYSTASRMTRRSCDSGRSEERIPSGRRRRAPERALYDATTPLLGSEMPSLIEPVIEDGSLAAVGQPEIAGSGLLLRPWTATDAPQLLAAFADDEKQRWHLLSLDSEAEAVDWMAGWTARWQHEAGASWAVTSGADSSAVLGQVAFRSLYLADGLAEVSYWVVPGHRRRRIGTTALHVLAGWAFDDLGLVRLELVHSVRNLPSCRTALRAGFRAEGTKRMLQRHQDGFHDMHLHSRVRGDE